MHARTLPLALAAVTTLCTACLENEEHVEVRPDGSLVVRVRSQGDLADLTSGYAVPLGGPFAPADAATREWLAEVAPATGGPDAQAYLARLKEQDAKAGQDKQTLVVEGTFATADDVPRWYAPESEPYRTAYLERDTSLTIERQGTRTVYVFERRFGSRRFRDWDTDTITQRRLHPDLAPALDDFVFSDAEWARVRGTLHAAWLDAGSAFVRSAIGSAVTSGVALPTAAIVGIDARLRTTLKEVTPIATVDRVRAHVLRYQELDRAGLSGDAVADELGALLEQVEADGRAAMRACLADGLADAGVPRATIHAVLARLEWSFTHFDYTGDLSDEEFDVRVSMPGVVVDGNFDEADGGTVAWEFDGKELQDADRVLRVVSVVD